MDDMIVIRQNFWCTRLIVGESFQNLNFELRAHLISWDGASKYIDGILGLAHVKFQKFKINLKGPCVRMKKWSSGATL